jgi:hypothetical protein
MRATGLPAIAAILATLLANPVLGCQQPSRVSNIMMPGSLAEDWLRRKQIRGDFAASGFMLRSASSMTTPPNDTALATRLRWRLFAPNLHMRWNSDLPFSPNDGALWSGRGVNVAAIGGGELNYGRFRLMVVPELVYAANDAFPMPAAPPNPLPPAGRSAFSSPWHANGQSIDLPIRFGDRSINSVRPGQSGAMLDAGAATIGFSFENEWWGPAVHNALILSSNAEGFPHVFARTSRPARTRLGNLEARWIAGWLNESKYFDSGPKNDLRWLSAAAITFSPRREPDLTVGLARAVFAPATRAREAFFNPLGFLRDVGHPNARPYLDSTLVPGPDQLVSLFFRWIQAKDGLEAYAELARAEFPRSVRDFLLFPGHTIGYTVGLQWLGAPNVAGGSLRVQTELTSVEQSPSYRFRDIGSWYTSRAVTQGYTNRGQSLGAAIGPGSSSQFAGLDYISSRWELGILANRVRWLEDAHSQQEYPDIPSGSRGWCEHDVSILGGGRGALRTRFGAMEVEYTSGWRLNVFFENPGPCPISAGRDVRTKSLLLRLTPRTFW